jgi:hypothetical protein
MKKFLGLIGRTVYREAIIEANTIEEAREKMDKMDDCEFSEVSTDGLVWSFADLEEAEE